jgi:hypothetical protein
LGDVPSEDVRGFGDSPRRDLGELVRLLVISARHMIELDAVELVLEGPHGLAVRVHLIVVAARVFHDLVDYELRVRPHVEAFDAYLDGDIEATKQGLLLNHVIRCGEVKAHSIPHVLPEG